MDRGGWDRGLRGGCRVRAQDLSTFVFWLLSVWRSFLKGSLSQRQLLWLFLYPTDDYYQVRPMFRNLFRPWADHQLCVMRQRATSRLTSCCSFACRVDHVADSQHAAVYLRMSCIQYELVSVSHTSCCCALWLARAKKFGKGLMWIDAGSKSMDVDVLTMVASGDRACIWRPHYWMFPFARCVNSLRLESRTCINSCGCSKGWSSLSITFLFFLLATVLPVGRWWP